MDILLIRALETRTVALSMWIAVLARPRKDFDVPKHTNLEARHRNYQNTMHCRDPAIVVLLVRPVLVVVML